MTSSAYARGAATGVSGIGAPAKHSVDEEEVVSWRGA